MGRIPRGKVREKFAYKRPESASFSLLIEKEIEKQELRAEYEALQAGLNYRKMSEAQKREFLCEMLK